MPVIRVSDAVMEILKQFAVPLQDTPDSVLRRLLNEYVSLKNGKSQAAAELVPPPPPGAPLGKGKQRYVRWIIASLNSQGGRARAREVIKHIGKTFGHEITASEREPLKSGQPRWIKIVNSVRVEMVKRGLLNKTEYGIWELTGQSKESGPGNSKSYHDS